MGVFDFLGNSADEKNRIVDIAKEISVNDKAVIAEMEKCLNDTELYVEENEDRFLERGIEVEEVEDDVEEVRWIAMVDILEANGYVCERDWKDELEDFVYFVGNLKGTKSRGLSIEAEWFEEEADVVEWCAVLDEKWAAEGVGVAAIDIDSDSYVLFPYEVEVLDKLCDLAEQLERRIDLVQNM